MIERPLRAWHRMSPGAKDRAVRALNAVHTRAYRRSGGRIAGRFRRAPVLLLTTTGRRSGRTHTTPLFYLDDAGRAVVVASFGGDDRAPAWFHNLRAQPEVTVERGGQRQAMRADVAGPTEKARLWPRLVALYPDYAVYQRATTRDIPVVILTPPG